MWVLLMIVLVGPPEFETDTELSIQLEKYQTQDRCLEWKSYIEQKMHDEYPEDTDADYHFECHHVFARQQA